MGLIPCKIELDCIDFNVANMSFDESNLSFDYSSWKLIDHKNPSFQKLAFNLYYRFRLVFQDQVHVLYFGRSMPRGDAPEETWFRKLTNIYCNDFSK